MFKSVDMAADFLKNQNEICLLCHMSPDGDTLGSAFAIFYALKSLGKKCFVDCADDFPKKFHYIYPSKMDKFKPKHYVTVDVADVKLLGKEQRDLPYDLCIDHHEMNRVSAKQKCIDMNAAATAEIVYDILKKMEIIFDKTIANCLYTGICTDTGCFKFSNTSAKTHRIAADLIDLKAESEKINFKLFEEKSKARLCLEKQVLENLEYYFNDRCTLVFVTKKMLKEAGADDSTFEGIPSIVRCPTGVEIGITVKECDIDIYKVSVRTVENFDAAEFCGIFGGGGHKMAAGFKIKGSALEVKRKILQAVEGKIIG